MEQELQNRIEELEQKIESLSTTINEFKEEKDNFMFDYKQHKHTQVDDTQKLDYNNISVSKTSKLTLNSGFENTAYLNFNYDNLGSAPFDITRYRMFQEENGGDLIIQSAVQVSAVDSLTINEDIINIIAADEIDLNTSDVYASDLVTAKSSTSTPAGGSKAFRLGLVGISICWGSGSPSLSAPKGSLYLRTDGTTTNDRAYINTNGSTTWTAITTVA